MAVKLSRYAFEHAKQLIGAGKFVFDERDAWSEHQPSSQQENDFIERHGFEEYGKWHLGINDEKPEDTKGRYEFPYGDFKNVHRCGVISAESRAGQYKHFDIEKSRASPARNDRCSRGQRGGETSALPSTADRRRIARRAEGRAFRNTLSEPPPIRRTQLSSACQK